MTTVREYRQEQVHTFLCGHAPAGQPHSHESVDAARACAAGRDTWKCDWLMDLGVDEDGEPIILPCGAEAYEMTDGRGTTCTRGHEDVHAWVRSEEGWDYAADRLEADALRRSGIDAVAMDGSGI